MEDADNLCESYGKLLRSCALARGQRLSGQNNVHSCTLQTSRGHIYIEVIATMVGKDSIMSPKAVAKSLMSPDQKRVAAGTAPRCSPRLKDLKESAGEKKCEVNFDIYF